MTHYRDLDDEIHDSDLNSDFKEQTLKFNKLKSDIKIIKNTDSILSNEIDSSFYDYTGESKTKMKAERQ